MTNYLDSKTRNDESEKNINNQYNVHTIEKILEMETREEVIIPCT